MKINSSPDTTTDDNEENEGVNDVLRKLKQSWEADGRILEFLSK